MRLSLTGCAFIVFECLAHLRQPNLFRVLLSTGNASLIFSPSSCLFLLLCITAIFKLVLSEICKQQPNNQHARAPATTQDSTASCSDPKLAHLLPKTKLIGIERTKRRNEVETQDKFNLAKRKDLRVH